MKTLLHDVFDIVSVVTHNELLLCLTLFLVCSRWLLFCRHTNFAHDLIS